MVFALFDDVRPVADALGAGPVTLVRGDLATVNGVFDGKRLVLLDCSCSTGPARLGLLDWACSTGPARLGRAGGCARSDRHRTFLVGCALVVDGAPDEVTEMYRRAAGPAYDDGSMQVALLSALCWLRWNQTRDIMESDDRAMRRREGTSLACRAGTDGHRGRAL